MGGACAASPQHCPSEQRLAPAPSTPQRPELVGGTKVSAAETKGGRFELAESCQRLQKLDPALLKQEMTAACLDRGILCKELEKIDKAAARDAYRKACQAKKLRCEDAKRLGG